MAAGRGWPLPAEVAVPQYVGRLRRRVGSEPVVERRQAFARKLRVSGRFIPTHPIHRKLSTSVGISSQIPSGGSEPPGSIPKLGEGLIRGKNLAVLHKRMLPVGTVLIAARINEVFELLVGYLV